MAEIYDIITKNTKPSGLEGRLPKRWHPELSFNVKSKTVEGRGIYKITLDGVIGQSSPFLKGGILERLHSKTFGSNLSLGYKTAVYGKNPSHGLIRICEEGFPSLNWDLQLSHFKDMYDVHLAGNATQLISQIIVQLTGYRPSLRDDSIFTAEFDYNLADFNKEAGYNPDVKFV
ncbi:hypothetical protein J4414_02215 [Candidatus Woesearchaeota archaeon]|nr:hypothetical protein [Candidatus Woesearchaeota archaeon]